MMKDRDLKEASANNVFGVQFSSTKVGSSGFTCPLCHPACRSVQQCQKYVTEPLLTLFSSLFQGEPFRSLEAMISIADKGLCEVSIDDRSVVMDSRGGGSREGLKNYGEIVGFRNRADGDRWDIVAPGLEEQLTAGSRHRLSKLLGVIMIKGGNHKLAVELAPPHEATDREAVAADVRAFMTTYAQTHPGTSKSRLKYMELTEAAGQEAGEGFARVDEADDVPGSRGSGAAGAAEK